MGDIQIRRTPEFGDYADHYHDVCVDASCLG